MEGKLVAIVFLTPFFIFLLMQDTKSRLELAECYCIVTKLVFLTFAVHKAIMLFSLPFSWDTFACVVLYPINALTFHINAKKLRECNQETEENDKKEKEAYELGKLERWKYLRNNPSDTKQDIFYPPIWL